MRILFDAHLSDQSVTGIGRYINKLLAELLAIDKQNEYHVFIHQCVDDEHPMGLLKAPNLKKYVVPFHGPSLRQHYEIKSFVKRIEPDIYHHPHFDLPLRINIPSIVTIHDLKYIRFKHFFKGSPHLKSLYMREMMKNAAKRAQRIIAVSQYTKDDMVTFLNVNPEKIDVIHHGMNRSSSEIEETNADSQADFIYNSEIKNKYILFVGEKRPHKNISRLIEAYHLARVNHGISHQLVIVGKSYTDYDPGDRIRELNLEMDVILLDYVDDGALSTLYKNADLFILPSLYEGFGFPVLEAMQYGVPVIASNVTALPEIVGHAGLLVDPHNVTEIANAIARVLSDEGMRSEIVKNGYQRVKKFTWKQCAEQTLNVYKSIYR